MDYKSDEKNQMGKKKIIVLVISIIAISVITALSGLAKSIEAELWIKIGLLILGNLCNGAVALTAMKLTDMKIDFDVKNIKQYLIGICIAVILSLTIALIPAICGFSLVGTHEEFSWFKIIYNFLFYIIVIGPVEELIFRVYLQDTFVGFFEKNKWIGVIIAAFIFGVWHMINGSPMQAAFTFGIGAVFGFCKYLIKNCKYLGLALGHGLYDFLNVIVRMFIV